MPPKTSKKRKESPASSTVTLHKFFSKSTTSIASFSSQPAPPARPPKTARRDVEDIIVIDSDVSDDGDFATSREAGPGTVKRSKSNDEDVIDLCDNPSTTARKAHFGEEEKSDSDVEIVEEEDARVGPHGGRSRCSRQPSAEVKPRGHLIASGDSGTFIGNSSDSIFGRASSLLRGESPVSLFEAADEDNEAGRARLPHVLSTSGAKEKDESIPPPEQPSSSITSTNLPHLKSSPNILRSLDATRSSSSFGSLTGQINSHSIAAVSLQIEKRCHASSSTQSDLKPTAKLEGGVFPEDDFATADLGWDTTLRDDEWSVPAEGQDREGDGDDGETELITSTRTVDMKIEEQSCPICAVTFAALTASDFQAHVNMCIDSTSVPSSSTSKPQKPPPPPAVSSKASSSSNNAFSFLMSSYTDQASWREAEDHEGAVKPHTKENGGRRKAPFYKVLQGMPIAVDAFRYGDIPGVTAYFLTHAHSDHYTNLSSSWKAGPIYCSETTANLVIHMLSVDPKWIHPLPMDEPTVIPDTGGVTVTLIEANHCPGSALFLFEGTQTVDAGDTAYKSRFVGTTRIFRYLHCGDFRACPQHVLHPAVKGKKLDHVYLDTTYLNPKYCFPPQPLVISACAELARRIVAGERLDSDNEDGAKSGVKQTVASWAGFTNKAKTESNASSGKTLVVVGTYSIGKERVVKAVAKALDTKIYCDSRKTAILRCEADPELHSMLTKDPYEAGVHVVPLGMISSDRFKDYMDKWKGKWSKAVAFRPTGWTYTPPAGTDESPSIPFVISRDQKRDFTYHDLKPMRNSTSQLMLYGVPYSEHSSFFELTCFALSLDWTKMIATVNVGSQSSRAKITRWIEKWEAERKKRVKEGGSAARLVSYRRDDFW